MHKAIMTLSAVFLLASLCAAQAVNPQLQGRTQEAPAKRFPIFVPDDYTTIQAAINAARKGDTIIVRPGTYFENIDFSGKAVTVRSESGASVTIIDGSFTASVVTFQSGEGLDSVLEGFTITNGDASEGGGICCYNSSPTIKDNVITWNHSGRGGGMFLYSSVPEITGNTIDQNLTLSSWGGAGIFCLTGSDALISNNMISDNLSADGAGGILCIDSSPPITNNIISGNRAQGTGG